MPGTGAETRREAAILLAHALGRPQEWLYAHALDPMPPPAWQRFEGLVERRARGVPVAYLVGRRAFWSFELEVTPAVLVPRPETERLVEVALDLVPAGARVPLADLGTGCGAIAIALARERPGCRVVATEFSPAALALAASNAARIGAHNIEFRRGRWCAPLADDRFALIASNPPYLRRSDPHLAGDGVRFEPVEALVAGEDGLDAIREIARRASRHLAPAGRLLLEHAHDQGRAVRRVLAAQGYRQVSAYRDHAGRERVVSALAAG